MFCAKQRQSPFLFLVQNGPEQIVQIQIFLLSSALSLCRAFGSCSGLRRVSTCRSSFSWFALDRRSSH
jgi:hypothetical protein